MNANPRLLISGAGLAGLTLAWWLERFGFEPTVIERRPDLCDEGYMIDFYGPGFDVAEKMELLGPLRERHYPVDQLVFVDRHGRRRGAFRIEALRKLLAYRHFNFMRGDLAQVLQDSLQGRIPIRFSTGLRSVQAQPDGVRVELTDGTRAEYDLLIGADGIHSRTRALAWGSEAQYERFLGYYVACGIIDDVLGNAGGFYSYQAPNRLASVYPIRGQRLATFFAFKSGRLDLSDRASQVSTLNAVFDEMGWMVPQLLAATTVSPQFYFDAVSQIELSPWHNGRVALVGDACQCLTLLAGQGASMAMAGAYVLANELQRAHGDHQAAFPAYEARLKPEIEQRQVQARGLARSFVPDSEWGIRLMLLSLRLAFWPGFRQLFRRQIGAGSFLH